MNDECGVDHPKRTNGQQPFCVYYHIRSLTSESTSRYEEEVSYTD